MLGILKRDTQYHMLKYPVINAGKSVSQSEYSENVHIQMNVTIKIIEKQDV